MKKNKTKWIALKDHNNRGGVRYREHETRKVKAGSNWPDRYFSLVYKYDGKTYSDGIGWQSEGFNAKKCFEVLDIIKGVQKQEYRLYRYRDYKAEQETINKRTVNDFFNDYIADLKRHEKDWKKAQSHFDHHISPALGDVVIHKLNEGEHWNRLIDEMISKKLSKRTRHYVAGTLSRFIKFLHASSLVDFQVAPGQMKIKGPKGDENQKTGTLDAQELADVLAALDKRYPEAANITRFAAVTACRFSEAAGLKNTDVDFKQNTIIFRKTKNRKKRVLEIASDVKGFLTEQIEGKPKGALVFPNKYGNQFNEPPKAFKEVVDELDINKNRSHYDKVTFHNLRHTACTLLSHKDGMTLNRFMQISGHVSAPMAIRYMHRDKVTQRQDVEILTGLVDLKRGDEEKGKVIKLRKRKGV